MPLILPGLPGSTVPVTPTAEDLQVEITIEQAGRTLDLTGWVQAGADGFDDPIVTPSVRRTPGIWGGVVTGVDVPPRRVEVDVLLYEAGGAAYAAARRRLAEVTDPLLPATIWAKARGAGDDTVRCITGRRVIQQQVSMDAASFGVSGWQALTIGWDCPDPMWRAPGEWSPPPWATPSAASGFFSDHFLPANVLTSTIIGADTAVEAPGDVEVLPTWVLDGPGTLWTVTHVPTGRTWSMDVTGLPRPITVIGDPAQAALRAIVTDGTGADQFIHLTAPYDLWPVPAGAGTVRVEVLGATSDTTVTPLGDGRYWRAFT